MDEVDSDGSEFANTVSPHSPVDNGCYDGGPVDDNDGSQHGSSDDDIDVKSHLKAITRQMSLLSCTVQRLGKRDMQTVHPTSDNRQNRLSTRR
jgi:hypothetical protein